MATGLNKSEKKGSESYVAPSTNLQECPMPSANSLVKLSYENKASRKQILGIEPTQLRSVKTGKNCFKIQPNSLVFADNLGSLQHLAGNLSSKITLAYMDPPYGTGLDFQSRSQDHSYSDKLIAAAYTEFIRRRIILLYELLSEEGSIYVHIGHQMLGTMKQILDEIFGVSNMLNIITRKKCSSKNYTRNKYSNLNDYILFYRKTKKFTWNQQGIIPDQNWIDKEYPKIDSKGRYKLVPIHAPGVRNGETGKPWKGMLPPAGKHWQLTPEKLTKLDSKGEIHWSSNNNPRRKVYLTNGKKIPYTDYWDGFRDAHHQSIKITGYPTEKNLTMLKLIVSASSNEDDIVIDPFCGSGSTLQAANMLKRKWIGIDQSQEAIKTTIHRLNKGLKPMGDYVTKDQNEQQVLDLLPEQNSVKFELVAEKTIPNKILKGLGFN